MATAKERSKQRLQIRHQLKKENPKGTSLTSKVTQKVKSKNALESLIGKKKADEATKKSSKKKSGGVTVAEASKANLIAHKIDKAIRKGDTGAYNRLTDNLSSKQKTLIGKRIDKIQATYLNKQDRRILELYDKALGRATKAQKDIKETLGIGGDSVKGQVLDTMVEEGLSEQEIKTFFKVIKVESEWDTNAKNPNSSARGLFQLLKVHGSDADRTDPVKATKIAIKLMRSRQSRGQDPFADWDASRSKWENMPDKEVAYMMVSDYGKGGGELGGGGDYSDVVGYKDGGNYYSINTYTGEKVKTNKASYKSLAKIDKKDYENIKTSLDTKMAKSSNKGDALNRDQLAALKAVRSDLAGKNSKQLLDWWKRYGPKEDPALLGKVNDYVAKTGGSTITSGPSYDLQNDPNYKALPDDLKKVADFFENKGLSSNTEQGTKLIQSLLTAADQSNAYYKQFFNIAADTMIRTNDEYQQAFGSQQERLNRQITQINEDLAKNKEFMTLEEQSDLTRLANEYKANLQTTQGTMAAAGLTQSTIRSEAEQRLAEQNKGLVEDTQRQYGKKITDLETAASRGNQEAQADLNDLKASLGFNITKLGRELEQQVGSANMPALSGYTPLGNITGSLVESKTQDIAQRAAALLGESNFSSLNLNL